MHGKQGEEAVETPEFVCCMDNASAYFSCAFFLLTIESKKSCYRIRKNTLNIRPIIYIQVDSSL